MTDDSRKEMEFCFEQDGKLIFDSTYKDNYLFNKTSEELDDICKIISECDEVYIDMEDLSSVKELKFKDGAKVYFSGSEGLPDGLDLSNCAEIHIGGKDLSKLQPQILRDGCIFSYIPQTISGSTIIDMPPFSRNIDVSKCSSVTIRTDLKYLSEMKFNDGAKVNLSGCSNLPENLDVSNCNEVNLNGCDLSNIKSIKFKDNAKINLAECTNIPADIDISKCSSVDLSGNNLSYINLKFADNSDVNLSNCSDLPQNLEISQCKNVVLSGCDLSNIKSIKFKDNAKINLAKCTNIPQNLDISNCSEINLSKCNLSHINDLKLKDGAQINLEKSKLPQHIDFSKCQILNLHSCDLLQTKEIKFRQGACINIQGTELPDGVDVSNCKEVWLTPKGIEQVTIGEAFIVVGGIGSFDKIDFSELKNFAVPSMINHEILGNSYTSLLGTKEFVFKDDAQYQKFLKNTSNISVPNGCKVSFTKENAVKIMKQDQQNAQATLKRKQERMKYNSSERTKLKTIMKKKPIQNNQISSHQFSIEHIEPNSSTMVIKPVILQKIKRQNG